MSLDLDRQKATAKHLQELYAIAVGVGLFIAMTTLIDAHQQFHRSAFPLVLAYVATLIPFYHGALRHLDDAYIFPNPRPHDKSWLLLSDFVWLFLEACIFFAMATYVDAPTEFAVSYGLLLSSDVVWISIYRHNTKSKEKSAQLGWAKLNIVTISVTGAIVLLFFLVHGASLFLAVCVAFIAIARTIADYHSEYRFYFPLDGDSEKRGS